MALNEKKLRVGARLKDNDPRMSGNRILTITALLPYGVVAKDIGGRVFTYALHRIHTDGKPRKSGLSLVTE